jgi:hypothetical protein
MFCIHYLVFPLLYQSLSGVATYEEDANMLE